jgi:hypothetical protein
MFYCFSVTCAKSSILLFYLRLSPHRYFRVITYGLLVIIVIYSLIVSFQFLFACTPMAKFWDMTITKATCIDYRKIWLFNALMNSLTDICMLILPIPMLWPVRIPLRQKMGVTAMLMVGVL